MQQHFDPNANIHVTRDIDGTARDLLHVEQAFVSMAGSAPLAARESLRDAMSLPAAPATSL